MSKRKEKLLRKQQERERKLEELVDAGIAVRVKYEKKPEKQAIPNRLSKLATVEAVLIDTNKILMLQFWALQYNIANNRTI